MAYFEGDSAGDFEAVLETHTTTFTFHKGESGNIRVH